MLSIFVYIPCTVVLLVDSASIFDQRQNGELNVQVDLKNLEIIAVLKGNKEEYVDYDYTYDYSEMTIKPQNGTTTTSKPLNISSSEHFNLTTAATITTTVSENQTILPIQQSSQNDISVANVTDISMGPENTLELTNTTSNKYETTVAPCKKGFVTNLKGDCELKLPSSGNALLKLVKLSQRLKQRRDNTRYSKPSNI